MKYKQQYPCFITVTSKAEDSVKSVYLKFMMKKSWMFTSFDQRACQFCKL